MAGLYLAALLIPTGCMMLLDHRFRLVLWRAPRRSARASALTLAIGIGFFLLWDLAAIASGHYRTGSSPAMTGIELLPNLPLEELVFVSFLAYTTLVLWGLLAHAQHRRIEGPPRLTTSRPSPQPAPLPADHREEER